MEWVDKALLILNLPIYNTIQHKHGIISHICISEFGGYWNGFYSKEDCDNMIFMDEFLKGIIKFEIIEYSKDNVMLKLYGEKLFEKANDIMLKKIKDFFGNDFKEDFLYYIDEDTRKEQREEYEETERNEVIYKFYLDNIFNRKKYNTMFEVESLVKNKEIAYIYMLLSDYDKLLREKYGEPDVGKNYPMWINSRQCFREEDILVDCP